MLDVQVNILGVDTGDFYSNAERRLHSKIHKIKYERKLLKDKSKALYEKLNKLGYKGNVSTIKNENLDLNNIENEEIVDLINKINNLNDIIEIKNKVAKTLKEKMLLLLKNKVENNILSNGKHHVRTLREEPKTKLITDKKIISVFNSSLIRMMDIKPDEFTDNFMVVQVYYFDIIKDLVYHGFYYNGEKYIYYTSSAGQIRTKKTVFIKESMLKQHEKTIMCGLTLDTINSKGGSNSNKYLSYMALSNSATDVWDDFDIDKTIVVEDFETMVYGTYDFIDDTDYSITRKKGYVPIPHTDGAGMILPDAFGKKQKNMMVRLSWVKGLLGVFDFRKFIEVNNCSPVIKDIYGQEHDVIKEDIQVILSKSQFKMWNYYSSWNEYKEYYKKYNCQAGIANVEEDRIKNSTINYQMLQTFTDFTDEDVYNIAEKSINKLNNLCKSIENIKEVFGVTIYNTNKTYLQKSIELYPNLLNDEYMKSELRSVKDSLINRYKSGKLEVQGKYTFILPDFYAACEYWFGHVENPNGILDDGEVYCRLFRNALKVDCLRSPHLYKEHAIRKNMACYEYEKSGKISQWFDTDAIYTSCKDLISKVLQFDVDGDKALVVADKNIVDVAEKNMKDIVPLYYNMKKAQPCILTPATIYDGLVAAFSSGNIGLYSNTITKIWNNCVFSEGTEEEKEQAIKAVKILCCENNFSIDSAKTLYMPIRPPEIKELISKYTKSKVPHFFVYAKNDNSDKSKNQKKLVKTEEQVEKRNNSFVNRLDEIIPNPRISFKKLEIDEIDYRLLMNNADIEVSVEKNENGRIIEKTIDPLIRKYIELNKEYHYKLSFQKEDLTNDFRSVLSKSQIKSNLFFKKVAKEIREELLNIEKNEDVIVDKLVKYLYGIKHSKNKEALWFCYGEYIYNNLKRNLERGLTSFVPEKEVKCVDCSEWFKVNVKNTKTCRCEKCQQNFDKFRKRKWKENRLKT